MRPVSILRSRIRQKLPALGRACLAALLLIAGCRKPIVETPPPEPIPESPIATPPPSTPAPATPQPRVAEATPAPSYLAPAGVFFLVAPVSVETASGITGLRPGTRLQQTASNEYTSAEGQKLTLRPDQVTNDLRIAQQVAGADVAAQQALRQFHAPRPAPAAPASATPPPAPAAAISASKPATPATTLSGSGTLGASHSRIKDGYVWEKDRNGIWVRLRPVR